MDQSFKCEYYFSNFNFIVSFYCREIYVADFAPFVWNTSNFPLLYCNYVIVTSCACHANG